MVQVQDQILGLMQVLYGVGRKVPGRGLEKVCSAHGPTSNQLMTLGKLIQISYSHVPHLWIEAVHITGELTPIELGLKHLSCPYLSPEENLKDQEKNP